MALGSDSFLASRRLAVRDDEATLILRAMRLLLSKARGVFTLLWLAPVLRQFRLGEIVPVAL